jgi:hypothetical protein
MAYIEYLEDETLKGLVKDVLDIVRKKKKVVEKDFHKNVIDPFSSIFDAAVSELNHDMWMSTEMARQCQKTLTNHIGNLHQKILGNVTHWEDLGTKGGVDIVCHDKKIIAEIKNKHNTLTGGRLADQYHTLDRLVMPKASRYKGYTSYLVNIIPKKALRFDAPFQPSDRDKGTKCSINERIRIVDGASFYALVTGREFALQELYDALPSVIEDIFHSEYGSPDFLISDKEQFSKYFSDAYRI